MCVSARLCGRESIQMGCRPVGGHVQWGTGKVDARGPLRARGGQRVRPTAHMEASNADSRALSVPQECRTSERPSLEVTTDSLRTTGRP